MMQLNGKSRRRPRRAAPGFTIAELLIVMVVMTILVAIAVPVLLGTGSGASRRGAVHNVRSSLWLGRQWAITHKETVTFTYNPGNSTNASYYVMTNSSGARLQSNSLPMDVELAMSSAITTIVFKTDGGLASGAAAVSLVIRDRRNTSIGSTVTVYGLTGGIRVE